MKTDMARREFIRQVIKKRGLQHKEHLQAVLLWKAFCDTPNERKSRFLHDLTATDESESGLSDGVVHTILEAAMIEGSAEVDLLLLPHHGTRAHSGPRIFGFAHLLLHLFLPRCDRELTERDLEEQLEDELQDPLIGLRWARLLYCKRVADNILAYTWGQLPKRVRTIIVSAIAAGLLKSLGLLPTLAELKSLGLLLWK
jgi:hypothetical protein